MIEIPDLAAGGLAAGTVLAFVLGGGLLRSRRHRARQGEEIAALRTHLDGARQEIGRSADAFTAEIVHLANQRMPAEATRAAHPHIQVPGPLHPELAGTGLGAGLDGVLDGLLTAMAQERKRVDAAARAGMRGATRDIQAGLYRLQDVLRGMQQRYDDPELSQTLFALDHENEQSLRRAQVTAVVCGAWVGLAREESHLVEAVTGGQSRLVGYHRVRIHNHLEPGMALVSHAVEPVAIIVAELLDNALRHSAPDTEVTVNLERAHHGVSVTIDDAGVGMATDERAYAQRMVAGRDPILLSELGDPPRMGLAAIGQLTRKFDLSVDLSSPSPYGGVRAVLLVKNHLLSRIDPVERPPAASTPRSTRPEAPAEARPVPHTQPQPHPAAHTKARPAAPVAARDAAAITHEPAPDGDALPQRRRRARADAVPAQAAAEPAAPRVRERTPEEAAAALGALQSGTAAARSALETEGNDPR
ncbi:ATP-binding protein [Streptomyces sp. RKAG337]|uniref:ATP-binding protein n=1 Tax=Streptomyces sp. RKAG337 TaxID=2893404 RepID=UPI002033B8D4|nr:ATP-binding protein [Streptomyces sp. RKAG337]MCM2429432.1 ATP-binding protein [Streptomyces sp. RKAG337]